MREGDDPRDIYWKRSTVGPNIVMERASDVRVRARLRLDNSMSGETPSSEESELFEKLVRETASLAVAHLRRGEPVSISTASGKKLSANPAEGADGALKFLALIDLEFADGESRDSVHLASQAFDEAQPPPSMSVFAAPVPLSRPAQMLEQEAPSPGSLPPSRGEES